jgi:hypothetical protein
MSRLSVFHPTTAGGHLDYRYCGVKHVLLAVHTWGLGDVEIDKGVNGPYVASAHFKCESMDAVISPMKAPGTVGVLPDLASIISIDPALQVSEIV